MVVLVSEISRYEQATAQINRLIQRISDIEFFQQPSENEWSIAQIVAHLNEAIIFWLDDIQALQSIPDGKWGRNHEHVRRLAAVAPKNIESLTRQIAVEKLERLATIVADVLATVTVKQLQQTAPSYNTNFNNKPLSFIVEHLIVKHIESHFNQMERHLEKVKLMRI
ncbi:MULTISPECIES: DinB family protein [unclassified Lysinibacillus]|uniref:DinB family protein n=1 Tax=unclassified Lysinibacillus TaxID=2636778 RepID=UPI0025571476|nr:MULTISPECIES: DinB family protein [unclassified Lysinibacillus]MDM5246617.1 DinB family protein [Lysinibacillus sp. G4S2]